MQQCHCHDPHSLVFKSRDNSGKTIKVTDYLDSYYWLAKNTPEDARVLAWWDYGYQVGVGVCRCGSLEEGVKGMRQESRVESTCRLGGCRGKGDEIMLREMWRAGGREGASRAPAGLVGAEGREV